MPMSRLLYSESASWSSRIWFPCHSVICNVHPAKFSAAVAGSCSRIDSCWDNGFVIRRRCRQRECFKRMCRSSWLSHCSPRKLFSRPSWRQDKYGQLLQSILHRCQGEKHERLGQALEKFTVSTRKKFESMGMEMDPEGNVRDLVSAREVEINEQEIWASLEVIWGVLRVR